MELSYDPCGAQLGFLWNSVGIPVELSWDPCGAQLGFLWNSVGIPVEPFVVLIIVVRLHFLRHLE